MARWRNNFEHDLKLLIYQLTGFEEGEENFDLCLQFVTSNIRYHRFLDVDSHKVTAALKGTKDKFTIHSQTEKSTALQKLTDEFLAQPIFEGKDYGKTDTHYALLHLLLSLSNSPTQCKYQQKPRILHVSAPKVEFDWAGFLLEGEPTPLRFCSSDSESDEDFFDDENGGCERKQSDEEQEVPQFPVVSFSTISPDDSALVAVDDVPMETGFAWLFRNVVVQYWCGQSEEIEDPHDSCNLSRDWENYKERTVPLYSRQSQVLLTETPLIREILWMLSGVSDLFVFIYNGHRFLIREDIVLSHLTESSLRSFLDEFTEHGAYVQDLIKFEQEVITQSCCYGNISTLSNQSTPSKQNMSQGICQTYQAFSRTVSSFIKTLRKELTSIEKVVMKQEEIVTLETIRSKLKLWLQKIKVIHTVYINGVKAVEMLHSNCQKASHLLSVLFDAVLEYDDMGQFDTDMINLLLPMWIETSKPYLDVIDEWITNGFLVDPRNEFIVRRNENVRSLDESFWETAFTIHVPPDQSEAEGTSSSSSQQKHLQSPANRSVHWSPSHWAPRFLQPILLEVVLSGKSMEMLQGLGRLQDVVSHHGDKCSMTKSLYDTFLDSLHECLGSKTTETEEKSSRDTTPNESVFITQLDQQMKIKGIYDPLLRINFDAVFGQCMERSRQGNQTRDSSNCTLSVMADSLKPVDTMLQQCLYPHIRHKYNNVCLQLVQILKHDYKLVEYLAAMRHFFLMEAGDTMFDFYTQIFDKIRLNEQWRDVATVNMILQEAVQSKFPEESNRLMIDVETLPTTKKPSPINITDCLRLNYKVPWPVDVVISTKCQDTYNAIFSFLLQVKRAKYCLDELRFSDLQKDDVLETSVDSKRPEYDVEMPKLARIHHMHVLRIRLLFFVNSLHNYIMTRILHSTGLEFKDDLEHVQNLDQIIELHNSYVDKIHERCLLHKTVTILKEAIMRVLNLVLAFHGHWDQGIGQIRGRGQERKDEKKKRKDQSYKDPIKNIHSMVGAKIPLGSLVTFDVCYRYFSFEDDTELGTGIFEMYTVFVFILEQCNQERIIPPLGTFGICLNNLNGTFNLTNRFEPQIQSFPSLPREVTVVDVLLQHLSQC